MSLTQYCAYALVTTAGVALVEGVDVGLVEIVCGGVGVGVGVGFELQPLKSKTKATEEATKDTEIRDPLMFQIYPVLAGVAHESAM